MSAAKHLVPELENGAVMMRDEFHAAYERCIGLRRAELIEGVVFMPSPVRYESHDKPAVLLRGWLFTYTTRHSGVEDGNDATLVLGNSEVQPDAFLMKAGSVPRDEDGYLVGPPQLVAEVAASTASRDLHSKKNVYLSHGVREYIVWRTRDKAIDWFELRDGQYVARQPDSRGLIESSQFPGLILNVTAVLAMDRKGVLAALKP